MIWFRLRSGPNPTYFDQNCRQKVKMLVTFSLNIGKSLMATVQRGRGEGDRERNRYIEKERESERARVCEMEREREFGK